ncbi:aldehyde dehydrogenase family protein [Aestuariivirga litoralis]|uniref:aldehyde dehydrogenase family protein n=1 Tax=Aestuariivirga litoralis TaxID=2650924 RepID=UPI0018C4BAF0|nr:aldehyde dehydrogenase family protein [Aestuariivirga litoralis]MBG1233849.1 aldehyde dehydrogenase family protein [Aestuariivirga litoralis]
MKNALKFYIDGKWVDPVTPKKLGVVNPSNEEVFAEISVGSSADVDKAVAAAQKAFLSFSETTREYRVGLLDKIIVEFKKREADLAKAISEEMGAPIDFSLNEQVWIGAAHLQRIRDVLANYEFTHKKGKSLIVREPIGVVGLITPWNWPLNQITCKVGPAIAAGCTMVLKPSEVAPLNAIIFAEILEAAGVPAGVFNLVNGDGPSVGEAMSRHPGIDMMSFTGSTRAGILVAKAAADTVKRVSQELGGKSANILFPDVDLADAVTKGINKCFGNSGQSCNAPTRMLVPEGMMKDAASYAKKAAEKFKVAAADQKGNHIGPVVSEIQYKKIQDLIQSGIDEGATLVTGGVGRPDGLNRGYFVQPTVFADVKPDMRIAKEEIFGPVISLIGYDTLDNAVTEANNTVYGLASYLQTKDLAKGREIAKKMRSGNVYINYPAWESDLPFGGYKQSGNGREYAEYGLEEFTEIKGIGGYEAA